MCGICGFFSSSEKMSKEKLALMNDQMEHRGPDASGIAVFDTSAPFCGLGHRRLSIIDLSAGSQPMSNEDQTIWISFNGEIYNHAVLREELIKKGHVYKTRCDTETIIHLYEEFGENCVEFLRGMFAFAIWDANKQVLFLARDRLGIKPLYYSCTSSGMVFASEIKSILKSDWVSAKPEIASIGELFTFGYVTNENTLFKGIYKLEPGHYALCSDSGMVVKKYWNIQYDSSLANKTFDEFKELILERFEEAVKLRMMSDVPLGVFLSGGIDSSAIAAIMSRNMTDPLNGYTIGFEKPYYSEVPYAKEVADRYHIDLHEVILTPDDFIGSIEKLIWHEDKPITWPSGVALYLLARRAQKDVKVVLTGEGSDELFGGYDKYWVSDINLRFGKYFDCLMPDFFREGVVKKYLWQLPIPLKFKKLLSHTLIYHKMDLEQIHFDNFYSVFPSYQQKDLFSHGGLKALKDKDIYQGSVRHFEESKAPSVMEKLLYTDIKTYLVQLLMKQDKMSMAASIESRVPFLDHKLVELAANIPSRFKISGNKVKYILKEAMKEILPAAIIERPKMGFPTPISLWLKEEKFKRYANEILLDNKTRTRGYYNPLHVERTLKEHFGGARDNSTQIWLLLNFELWNRLYFDK